MEKTQWNLLGGAIISVVFLLMVTICNNLYSQIYNLQVDMKELHSLKERVRSQEETNLKVQKELQALRDRFTLLHR